VRVNRVRSFERLNLPGDFYSRAAKQMRSLDVGVLPVCNGDRLVGMLTDRDLAIGAVADGRDPKTTTVGEAMTPEVAY
jgi:CBS domain-containing protein